MNSLSCKEDISGIFWNDQSMPTIRFYTSLLWSEGIRQCRKSISKILIQHVTKKNPVEQSLDQQYNLTIDEQQQLKSFTNRLLSGEPVQYIIEEATFLDLV